MTDELRNTAFLARFLELVVKPKSSGGPYAHVLSIFTISPLSPDFQAIHDDLGKWILSDLWHVILQKFQARNQNCATFQRSLKIRLQNEGNANIPKLTNPRKNIRSS